MGLQTFNGYFYNVKKVDDRHEVRNADDALLFETKVYLSPSVVNNLRIVYGITNLLSDLGGVMNIMISMFGIIFRPVS